MKSIVHQILAMTTVVACVSCLLGHVAADEGKPAASEKQEKKEARVVVIKAQGGEEAAALLKQVDQLKGEVSKEVHEKIRQKLAEALKSAAKSTGGVEGKVEAHAIIVGEDGKTYGLHLTPQAEKSELKKIGDEAKNVRVLVTEADGDTADKQVRILRLAGDKDAVQGAQKVLIQAMKENDGDGQAQIVVRAQKDDSQPHKAIAIAVAADDKVKDQPVSAKHEAKQYSVKIEDGKVFLNGKPVAQWNEGKHVLIKVDGKDGDHDVPHHKVLFLGKDGKIAELDMNVDVRIDGEHTKALFQNEPAERNIVIRRRVDSKEGTDTKTEEQVRQFKVQARQLKPGQPLKVMAAPGQARVIPTDVNARLKNIEAELKKIRTLLEKMQGDDDEHGDNKKDDDDDDDD